MSDFGRIFLIPEFLVIKPAEDTSDIFELTILNKGYIFEKAKG